MRLARWIRRRRIAWLERKASKLERSKGNYRPEFRPLIASEVHRMRKKASLLRRGLDA